MSSWDTVIPPATRPPSDVWWHWIPACRSRLRVCRSTAVAGRPAAVIQASLQVGNGDHDLVIAGGCESMSNVAFYSTDMRWGGARSGVQVHDGLARGRTTAAAVTIRAGWDARDR